MVGCRGQVKLSALIPIGVVIVSVAALGSVVEESKPVFNHLPLNFETTGHDDVAVGRGWSLQRQIPGDRKCAEGVTEHHDPLALGLEVLNDPVEDFNADIDLGLHPVEIGQPRVLEQARIQGLRLMHRDNPRLVGLAQIVERFHVPLCVVGIQRVVRAARRIEPNLVRSRIAGKPKLDEQLRDIGWQLSERDDGGDQVRCNDLRALDRRNEASARLSGACAPGCRCAEPHRDVEQQRRLPACRVMFDIDAELPASDPVGDPRSQARALSEERTPLQRPMVVKRESVAKLGPADGLLIVAVSAEFPGGFVGEGKIPVRPKVTAAALVVGSDASLRV